MMMKRIFCIVFICGSIGYSFAQISVEVGNRTAQELVEKVLLQSDCAETSNWNMRSGNTSVGNIGVGYFNANGANFPFQEGIVVSTGRVQNIPGPNTSDLSDGDFDTSWTGDQDLVDILPNAPAEKLQNASYLEFDFVPKSPQISFNFFMASEEYYLHYPCEFSDVFAFILTDSAGNSTNLAVIPNTTIPIQVTSIHNAIAGDDGCSAENEEYYNGNNPPNAPINFNGQTVVFTANSAVVPNDTYHIKIVIADYKDGNWDSAVFIEGGSFNTGVNLGEDRTIENDEPACFDVDLDATTVGAQDYTWSKDGTILTALQGQSKIAIAATNNNSGLYKVVVDMGAGCFFEDEIDLEFVTPSAIQDAPVKVFGCDLDRNGEQAVDLTENEDRMLGALDGNIYKFSYHNSLADAESGENAIGTPSAFVTANREIFVRMEASKDCYETTSFLVEIVDPGEIKDLNSDYVLCVNDNGVATSPQILDIDMDASVYRFQWYRGSDLASATLLPGETNAQLSVTEGGTYTVAITHSAYRCAYERSTTVRAIGPPTEVLVKVVSQRFVAPNKVEVSVMGDGEYRYKLDDGSFQSENVFDNVAPGTHKIVVEDIWGCAGIERLITIVDFPRFFTPNGDTFNDTWNLLGTQDLANYSIYVFDRYGKLLKKIRKTDTLGWDGTFNQNPLPEDDYWFRLYYVDDFGESQEFKGHFSLKR